MNKSDAIEFFKWMQGSGRNWKYFNIPGWRSLEEWYKIFKTKKK